MCKHQKEKIVLPVIGKAQCLDCGEYIDQEKFEEETRDITFCCSCGALEEFDCVCEYDF